MEHSAFSMETVADMATLARALDFPMVVRPPEGNREWVTRLLDAGVWNLHIPQVDTPEQAAEVASYCRYAPLGERGMYGFGPHTEYRTLPPAEHMAAANARVHVTSSRAAMSSGFCTSSACEQNAASRSSGSCMRTTGRQILPSGCSTPMIVYL